MNPKEAVTRISEIVEQAKQIAMHRKHGLGIKYVYYVGGTLCVDMNHKNKDYVILINVSSETFSVHYGADLISRQLLPIKALKSAFEIYEISKGKTEYYQSSLSNSCIRHIIN
jgi:hypothetical protein